MVYLHVPFCRSFCTYCDFYSEICRRKGAPVAEDQLFKDYADAVAAEIRERKEEIAKNTLPAVSADTLYIGGGTPSVLPLDVLSRIVSHLKSSCLCRIDGSHFSEFTVEVNPEDIVEKGSEYVVGLLDLGVNRISVGIQSFDDGILHWMNRRHTASRAKEAFEIIRKADSAFRSRSSSARLDRGPAAISIDLIFGLSQLSDEVWNDTITQALALGSETGFTGPEHISAYQLSIEEGSALAKLVSRGRYGEASEDQSRRQYEILCCRLGDAGYHHYEVSNFARPGFEAVHNSAYWHRLPYVGLGPGAHSFGRSSSSSERHKEVCTSSETLLPVNPAEGETRSWNSRELPRRLSDGTLATYSRTFETLTQEDIRVERIMLSLRTDTGIPAEELYSSADSSTINRLLSEGALELVNAVDYLAGPASVSSLRIPESRLFTSDEIIRELI